MEESLTEKALRRLSKQKLQPQKAVVNALPLSDARPDISVVSGSTHSAIKVKPFRRGSFNSKQLAGKRILHPDTDDRATLNSFRYLRHKMVEKLAGHQGGIVLVSSALRGGGASFSAINLATVLAFEKGVKTILVECNQPQSSLCGLLEVELENGWLDYVEDENLKVEDVIYETGIPGLSFVPAGGLGRSADSLTVVGQLKKLLHQLRAEDTYIILDGPSLDDPGGPQIYSEACDCIMLVVPYGRITPETLNASMRGINKDKIAGVVINRSASVW